MVTTRDGEDVTSLLIEIESLKQRIQNLKALTRLLVVLLRASGFRLDRQRLPEGQAKNSILRSIEKNQAVMPLPRILRMLRLSPARYYAWRRAQKTCELDDRSSCPKTFPAQLTPQEIQTIKDMVTNPDYRHMPLRTLALYAQRAGRVFVSATTWFKLVRSRGWRRPRQRLYPEKPNIGIRAEAPNEYWHIDVTVLRLLDGTRAYLHAVIDNFSRRVLAWRLVDRLQPVTTCEILAEAAKHLDTIPTVVADSGIENVNTAVDALISQGSLRRVLAQVEVTLSNSMIEAFWRSLRHRWLYLHSLDTLAELARLVAFYVQEHNSVMPHSAFFGQTPDEMYFRRNTNVVETFATARVVARAARITANRSASCGICQTSVDTNSSNQNNDVANAPP